MADYQFSYYPPPPEDISGDSVMEQTERALNELGGFIDDANGNASSALEIAQAAEAAAQEALNTANNAQTTADNANTTANNALDVANQALEAAESGSSAALERANEAYDLAAQANTTANNADTKAEQASTDADTALDRANEAYELADSQAGAISGLQEQLTEVSDETEKAQGIFEKTESVINANDHIETPDRLYVTNAESLNFPLSPPLYFRTYVDEAHERVHQWVWTGSNDYYIRTGELTGTPTDSSGIVSLEYTGTTQETNTLDVALASGVMSVSLGTTGDWTLTQSTVSNTIIECTLSVTNATATQSGYFQVQDSVLVRITDGVAEIEEESAQSPLVGVYIESHTFDNTTGALSIVFRVEWEFTDVDYSATFTEWRSLSGEGGGSGATQNSILQAVTATGSGIDLNNVINISGNYYAANTAIANLPIAKEGFLEVRSDSENSHTVQRYTDTSGSVWQRFSSSNPDITDGTSNYECVFSSGTFSTSVTLTCSVANGRMTLYGMNQYLSISVSSQGTALSGTLEFWAPSSNTAIDFPTNGYSLTITPATGTDILSVSIAGDGTETITSDVATFTGVSSIKYLSSAIQPNANHIVWLELTASWLNYSGTIEWTDWIPNYVELVDNQTTATSVTISATTLPNVLLTPAADITITINDLGLSYNKVTAIKIVPTAAINITWVFTGTDGIIWTNLESLSSLAAGEIGIVNIMVFSGDCVAAKILPA